MQGHVVRRTHPQGEFLLNLNYKETIMAKKTTSTHRTNSGPVFRTTTTRYDDGSKKSVTRTEGTLISPGRLTSITRTDRKGNSRTTKY